MPKVRGASEFIHYVQFKSPTGTEADGSNTRGDVDRETYTNAFTAYVSIEPLTGRELFVAQQVRNDLTHKVTTHYRDDIKPNMRFTWNSRTFNVGPTVGSDGLRGQFVFFYCGECRG